MVKITHTGTKIHTTTSIIYSVMLKDLKCLNLSGPKPLSSLLVIMNVYTWWSVCAQHKNGLFDSSHWTDQHTGQ